MKRTLSGLASGLVLLVAAAQAQVTTNPPGVVANPNGLLNVLTNFPSVASFTNVTLRLDTGVRQEGPTGTGFFSTLAGTYYWSSFGVGAEMANGSVAGAVDTTDVFLSFHKPVGSGAWDVEGHLGGGYQFVDQKGYGRAGLKLSYDTGLVGGVKTYAGIDFFVEPQQYRQQQPTTFSAGLSWLF